MKVVLFCGGLGTRLREHSDTIPKPLVNIGIRPIMWHLMRYYAHFGHKDFVLALGYRGDMIREYFLRYNECLSTDFVLSEGGKQIQLLGEGIDDWRITFVDTGMHANLGQRLMRVKHLVKDEPMFLANYSDGLTDMDLGQAVAEFERSDATASFMASRPAQSFHQVSVGADGVVQRIESMSKADLLVNAGFFCLRPGIFDVMQDGEELVEQPFQRLLAQKKLRAHPYHGFWATMDTFKDKINLDRMEAQGNCPWMVWKR